MSTNNDDDVILEIDTKFLDINRNKSGLGVPKHRDDPSDRQRAGMNAVQRLARLAPAQLSHTDASLCSITRAAWTWQGSNVVTVKS